MCGLLFLPPASFLPPTRSLSRGAAQLTTCINQSIFFACNKRRKLTGDHKFPAIFWWRFYTREGINCNQGFNNFFKSMGCSPLETFMMHFLVDNFVLLNQSGNWSVSFFTFHAFIWSPFETSLEMPEDVSVLKEERSDCPLGNSRPNATTLKSQLRLQILMLEIFFLGDLLFCLVLHLFFSKEVPSCNALQPQEASEVWINRWR